MTQGVAYQCSKVEGEDHWAIQASSFSIRSDTLSSLVEANLCHIPFASFLSSIFSPSSLTFSFVPIFGNCEWSGRPAV